MTQLRKVVRNISNLLLNYIYNVNFENDNKMGSKALNQGIINWNQPFNIHRIAHIAHAMEIFICRSLFNVFYVYYVVPKIQPKFI